ncbi:MAG: DUF5011 domain-containing protein [Lachnospiraceae bacterium]|nr:DUF5011 domain-containing protein [Lachnospiraceae bacterium]
MDNRVKAIIAGSVAVGIIFICICVTALSDKKGPVIKVDDSIKLTYKAGDDDSVLLQGVTAIDKRDGNVSDSIVVDSVIIDGDVIKVKYAAKDFSNNVTISKVYREVSYISSDIDTNDSVEKDNILENSETKEDTTVEINHSEVSSEVTDNSVGEIDKDAVNASGIPVIVLTQKEVTINKGEQFSDMKALSYVKETYDDSGDVSRRIRISGNDGELQEGDYEIKFTVSDKDGNVSEPAILILHVKA